MPSTGTPSSSSSRRSLGAPSAYTEAGPPESKRPRGRRRSTSSSGTSCGKSSANTPHSRTRRAISCEYCPPKSSTRTSSCPAWPSTAADLRPAASSVARVPSTRRSLRPCRTWSSLVESRRSIADERRVGGGGDDVVGRGRGAAVHHAARSGGGLGRRNRSHAYGLVALELLALGLERGGHHHLGAVEGRDVLVAAGGHGGAQAPHQVEGPVVLVGGSQQNLLERAVLGGLDPRASRKRGVEGGHAPVVAAPRRLIGPSERRADHHGVGTAGERLGHVAAVAHAAVGDDLDVLARLEHVLRAGRLHVRDRGGLRHSDAEH